MMLVMLFRVCCDSEEEMIGEAMRKVSFDGVLRTYLNDNLVNVCVLCVVGDVVLLEEYFLGEEMLLDWNDFM